MASSGHFDNLELQNSKSIKLNKSDTLPLYDSLQYWQWYFMIRIITFSIWTNLPVLKWYVKYIRGLVSEKGDYISQMVGYWFNVIIHGTLSANYLYARYNNTIYVTNITCWWTVIIPYYKVRNLQFITRYIGMV